MYIETVKGKTQAVHENGKITIISYSSKILELDTINKVITFYEDWKYSNTTSRHRNLFFKNIGYLELDSTSKVEKAIKHGKIIINNIKTYKIMEVK